jgi:two-component system OmpR family response regulator
MGLSSPLVIDGSTRVLVVDDEPSITELVSLALRYEGFDVSSAHDGRDHAGYRRA